jgi:hypothetical protein
VVAKEVVVRLHIRASVGRCGITHPMGEPRLVIHVPSVSAGVI